MFVQVYDSELEHVTEFMGLTDFCKTFKLHRGKCDSDDDDPDVVGQFKVSVCLVSALLFTMTCADVFVFRALLRSTRYPTTPG